MLSTGDEIKPINHETVHRICSGQVVLSLAIAVKELVENAIDAGATNIEIRLKNYGQDSIEVIDNGSGVQEANFTALTLKHYTSKIREFNDLETVATLGFRGEALSSLCALADLSIITRHSSAEHGTKLQYDHNGHIMTQSVIARTVGTTVQLSNLFASLPVRRKEFVKNVKKEFTKMCTLLYAYCLVCTNVKFTCSNQVQQSKNVVLSTQGAGTVTDNIINIFGAKQTPQLVEVALAQPSEAIASDFSVRKIPEASPFEFNFFISSAAHGSGRSASDRQFFYINSRPCEPQKLAKLINETYRSFNCNQYPFVYLNVRVLTSLVDVNVTPDKRQIFLEQEKLLMATVKMSLLEAFKNLPSTYKIQNFNLSASIAQENGEKRSFDEVDEKPNVKSFLEMFKKRRVDVEPKKNDDEEEVVICPVTPKKVQKSLTDFKIVKKPKEEAENICDEEDITPSLMSEINETSVLIHDFINSEKASPDIYEGIKEIDLEDIPSTSSQSPPKSQQSARIVYDSPCKTENGRESNGRVLNFSLGSIKKALEETERVESRKKEMIVKFRAEIAPQSNKDAEHELQKQFSKEMFKEMEIIGQFNYGFIVAALDEDLFIIDQHASDEKYNFEMLQRNTVIDSQVLVNAKPLQLSAVDEQILLDNEKLFNKSGFFFAHNPSGPATERVKLTKIPVSRNTVFGKDDIDEMIYMLKEGAVDSNCRPSRIRGMFASRACRKSVMVGKALNKAAMKKLVVQMGDIEQPWNCPHGRPTMRHLINMNLLE